MKEYMRAMTGDPLCNIALFAGMFLFVFIACLLTYREEKDAEKRKDTLFQWITLDSLFAVGIGLSVFLAA